MKKFTFQAILLLLVIGVGVYLYSAGGSSGTIEIPFLPQPTKFADLQINNTTLKVEIADTLAKRSKGLGGRQSLGQNEGMLFVFEKTDKYPFWMKGLSFPLDFVWIKDDKVVDYIENVASPINGQSDASLPIYSSKVEVDKALEVNAGTVKRLNIKVGDTISIK